MSNEEFKERFARIEIARKAILEDLKLRAKSGDVNVKPLDPECEHRWHKPQDNYSDWRNIP